MCQNILFKDKVLSCRLIKDSYRQTLFPYGLETRVLLINFTQQLRRENADAAYNYFALLDAADLTQTLVLNQIVKTEER